MNSFYSLIKITLNQLSDDNLTIGIILSGPDGFRVKFSENKKHIIKSVLPIEGAIIDFLEREIVSKIKEQTQSIKESKTTLFEFSSLLDSNYFSYLSRYSNGLLKFTSPALITDTIDDSKFHNLFSLFVDSEEKRETIKNPVKEIERIFHHKVQSNLIERVKEKVHTNQTFDNKLIPSLFSPFQLDCIGINGVLIGAKALPFIQTKETLHKSVNTYVSVIAQLSSRLNRSLKENNFFLIADQPEKKSSAYALWNQLSSGENLFTVISSDESAMVAEMIEEKQAHRFLD